MKVLLKKGIIIFAMILILTNIIVVIIFYNKIQKVSELENLINAQSKEIAFLKLPNNSMDNSEVEDKVNELEYKVDDLESSISDLENEVEDIARYAHYH